jgi:hypothetical protein
LFDSGAFYCFRAFPDERRRGRPLQEKMVEICKWLGLFGVEGNRKGIMPCLENREADLTSAAEAVFLSLLQA